MQVVVTFPVNEKRIRTGLDKFFQEKVWIRDHHVYLERETGHAPERLHAAFPSFAISSRSSLATYALVFCMFFSSTPRNSSRLAYRLLSLPKLEIEPFNHLLVSPDSCLRGELVLSLHALQTGRGSGIEFPRLSTHGLRSRPPD